MDRETKYYGMFDQDIFLYHFVRDIVLDYDIIISRGFHTLFSKNQKEMYKKFVKLAVDLEYDVYEFMYEDVLPTVIKYYENISIDSLVYLEWIRRGQHYKVFALFCHVIGTDIREEYKDFIIDVVNYKTARKIAISKLKRNKIVNEGILLKLSMKNCGMF